MFWQEKGRHCLTCCIKFFLYTRNFELFSVSLTVINLSGTKKQGSNKFKVNNFRFVTINNFRTYKIYKE